MTTGVFPGKFLPPHRGHLASILRAHSMCDKLYVVVCERKKDDGTLCAADDLRYISGVERRKWLKQETQGIDQLDVILLDEEAYGIPSWPQGWERWARVLEKTVPEPFQVIFGGETEYQKGTDVHFPNLVYRVIDPERTRWTVSATQIRRDPAGYWDYILGSARPFFCKTVLITGTESCGKTTLTKKLGKIYNTSWSEEIGRSYSRDHLGEDEGAFSDHDFLRIAHMQLENDMRAVRSANRICFVDTDAVVTDYYAQLYLGHECPSVRNYVDLSRFELILLLKPDVDWIPDGLRFAGEQNQRWHLHQRLKDMYVAAGVKPQQLREIGGDYNTRIETAIAFIDRLSNGEQFDSTLGT